jgi:hypothetical protein
MSSTPASPPSPAARTLAIRAALLAVNLLFLMVWGFAGLEKVFHGPPAWFGTKFGATILAKFPGVTASFWLLAMAEVAAFLLAAIALGRGEFVQRRAPIVLSWALAWSLLVFVQLGFGQWLLGDYTGGAQLFTYFAGNLVALHFVLAVPVLTLARTPASAPEVPTHPPGHS